MARGVIARTIEQLEHDDTVDRIDVIYVCSNAEIAQQNLGRLDVTGDPHLRVASRLTLLAKHARQFASNGGRFTKPVNLISFTPGTSFEMGWQTGKAEERALLFLLLEPITDVGGGHRRRTALNLLRGQVSHHDRFAAIVGQLDRELADGIDPGLARAFHRAARQAGLLRRFNGLLDDLGRRQHVPDALRDEVRDVTGKMRAELARVSVDTLEPDLVILDEFQRFRSLLDEKTEAGQLAHHLFNHGQNRVLLLSATPYKPFTCAGEFGEDHHREFLTTLEFLADGASGTDLRQITADLADYRHAAVGGEPVRPIAERLRAQLLQVMCRSERPDADAGGMLREITHPADDLDASDLLGYVALRDLARAVDGQVSVEYWKSAPYFVNFCDGYQLSERIRTAVADPGRRAELAPLLRRTQQLHRAAISRFDPVDYGNARLRRLAADTVDAGWWQLLWVPPSLPYLAPGGPYAEPFAEHVTKQLVFSSWAATPTAVASLLSYQTERLIAAGSRLEANTAPARRRIANRLSYSLDAGRPQAMTTLALFWPMPGLAPLADPLQIARDGGPAPVDAADAERAVAARLATDLPSGDTSLGTSSDAWYWTAALRYPGSMPAALPGSGQDLRELVIRALGGDVEPDEDGGDGGGEDGGEDGAGNDPRGLAAHVDRAFASRADDPDLPPPPPDLAATLAALALHSPGNVAWRALHRIAHDQPAVTAGGLWAAAAVLAAGLRSLFSRLDATLLLDKLIPDEVYWRAVLRYCAWGNLQATLDEYLHHLLLAEGARGLDDTGLGEIAAVAARAIALRPSRYGAFDPLRPDEPIPFPSRFALRYSGRRQNQEDARQPEIRRAFNSPFWPFVLATTSVGQEGIDFHWWSHSLLHWNTPANPVDFEQREGRIHRYAGHAIRRNIVHRHRAAILASTDPNPWHAAYLLATDECHRFGEFAPHWVYPGPAHIERHLVPYPLSADHSRLARLKDDLALYRLTFGQPRQEDMLELLRHQGLAPEPGGVNELRIDLRPPQPDEPTSTSTQ